MRFLILLLFFAANVSAQPLLVTNSFNNNSVADADAVNRNFADITNGLNTRLNIYTGEPWNTALGHETLMSNTTGVANTASGYQALEANTEGYRNTASGYRALHVNTTGYENTASGYQALHENTAGYENTASGSRALWSNTEGYWNTAIGNQALYGNTTGSYNTASGTNALSDNTSGERNTASGGSALPNNSTGSSNTAIGYGALFYNETGDYNTAIGSRAGNSLGTWFVSNSTAIGYDATFRGSNQVQIGNDDIENVYLGRRSAAEAEGEVVANLHLYGTAYAAAHALSSDGRLKENIAPLPEGLGIINDLNPVSYHRIGEANGAIEMGLVAQEVQATLNQHRLNSGMVLQPDEDGYLYLRYNDLLAPMIKAIQELDDASEAKDAEIESLKQQLQSQQEELLAIVQSQQEQIAQLQRMVEHQFAMN